MILAYKAKYIKPKNETNKIYDNYCLIEIKLKQQNHTQVMLINNAGLVMAFNAQSIISIPGYRNYIPLDKLTTEFGAGGLEQLMTNGSEGMLEIIGQQMDFSMRTFATAFGTALLQLADIDDEAL